MSVFLHVLGCLVLLPYLGLAMFFLFIRQAAHARGLAALFDLLLSAFVNLFGPSGLLSFALWLGLVALGFAASTRRLAALCLACVAGASLALILILQHGPFDAAQLLFLAPCALVAIASVWSWRRGAPAP